MCRWKVQTINEEKHRQKACTPKRCKRKAGGSNLLHASRLDKCVCSSLPVFASAHKVTPARTSFRDIIILPRVFQDLIPNQRWRPQGHVVKDISSWFHLTLHAFGTATQSELVPLWVAGEKTYVSGVNTEAKHTVDKADELHVPLSWVPAWWKTKRNDEQ